MPSKKKMSLVRQFKAEYRARIEYERRMLYLQNKLIELDNQFEAHSPMLGGERVQSNKTHDQRLAEYTVKRARIAEELDVLEAQARKVDRITEQMNPELLKHFENITRGKYTQETAADYMGISRMKFRDRLDDDILKAHNKVLNK